MDKFQEIYSILTLVMTGALLLFIGLYMVSVVKIQSYIASSNIWKGWDANGRRGMSPEWHTYLCNRRMERAKEVMFFTFVQAVLVSLSIFGPMRRAIIVEAIIPTFIGGFFTLFAFCFCLLAVIYYMDICHTNEVDGAEPFYRLTSDKDKGQIYRALYGALVCIVLAATFINIAGLI